MSLDEKKKEELIGDTFADADGGELALEKISLTMAGKANTKDKVYKKKHFDTPELIAMEVRLSSVFPYEIGVGNHTANDMLWELPIIHGHEISRQVVYSPKTGNFTHIILRYTDEDELDSEYKVINDKMTLEEIESLVSSINNGGNNRKTNRSLRY